VLALVVRILLAGAIAAAALLKLRRPGASARSLETFGIRATGPQWVVLAAAVAVELGLAAGVAAGSRASALAAAVLLLGFAALLGGALARGRRGEPCPCFGSHGSVGPGGVVRNLALAGALISLPWLSGVELSTSAWLAIGLGVALCGVAALAVAVAALAREVGLLRLRVAPAGALELLSEGPELGRFAPIVDRFSISGETRVALAVFSSEACRICAELKPAVAVVAGDPAVAVRVFDEHADAEAWDALCVPGSPYAVAIDLDGTVRAKGTFNNLAQLESVVATAQRRAQTSVHA
jgi:hypothetical protein